MSASKSLILNNRRAFSIATFAFLLMRSEPSVSARGGIGRIEMLEGFAVDQDGDYDRLRGEGKIRGFNAQWDGHLGLFAMRMLVPNFTINIIVRTELLTVG